MLRGVSFLLNRNGFNVDFHRAQGAAEPGRDVGVGDDRVQFVQVADEGQGSLVHFRGIEYADDFTGTGNHDLIGAGLFHAGGGKTSLHADAVYAQKQFVAVEEFEVGLCKGTDDGIAGFTDGSAQQDNPETLVFDGFKHGGDRVGDDGQIREVLQIVDNLQRGGAGVDEDGVPVFDMRRRSSSDGLLFLCVDKLLEVEITSF